MYNSNKLGVYQNTANMLKNASSYREVIVPVSEVAIQFAELLNEVQKNAKDEWKEHKKSSLPHRIKSKKICLLFTSAGYLSLHTCCLRFCFIVGQYIIKAIALQPIISHPGSLYSRV